MVLVNYSEGKPEMENKRWYTTRRQYEVTETVNVYVSGPDEAKAVASDLDTTEATLPGHEHETSTVAILEEPRLSVAYGPSPT